MWSPSRARKPARLSARPSNSKTLAKALPLAVCFLIVLAAGGIASQGSQTIRRIVQIEELPNTISSLKGVKPLEADLSEYVVDKLAAQQLGKALFWDIQVGSNGVACASCHFTAGGDIRDRKSTRLNSSH